MKTKGPSSPKLSIILVNWNGRKFMGPCLESLAKQSRKDFEVVLVDNASKDDSLQIARKYGKKLSMQVLANKANLGFAQANNQGVEMARSDLCLLLNVDTTVSPSFVSDLLSEVRANPGAALIGIDPIDREGRPESRRRGTSSVLLTNVFHVPVKTPFYFAGCSVLLDRRQLGLPFDDVYFAYGEDLYLAWKARLEGKKVAYTTKPKVRHYQGATGSKVPDVVAFHAQKNRIMNFLIFYSFGSILRIFPLFLASVFLQNLYEALRLKRSALMRLKALLWIILNFGNVLEKRAEIQKKRKVGDREITRGMTGLALNSRGFATSLINSLSLFYCRIMGVKTFESGGLMARKSE